MALATGITFLFILLTPVYNASVSGKSVNYLDYPGDTVKGFNTLWFNDFRALNDNQSVCFKALRSASSFNAPQNNTNTTTIQVGNTNIVTSSNLWNFDVWLKLFVGGGSSSSGLDFVSALTGGFLRELWGLMMLMKDIMVYTISFIFGCSLDTIRLLIGFTIVFYWSLKLFPVLEFMFKLFGLI